MKKITNPIGSNLIKTEAQNKDKVDEIPAPVQVGFGKRS